MDPVRFASEYLALFKESGNSLFYCFDRSVHLQPIVPPEPHEDIHCSIDFNVDKQCTGFFVLRGNQMQYFAEHRGSPDTQSLAMTANNVTDMYFDPKGCPELIRSMERTKWVEGNKDLALIDKTEDLEHFSDGVRYATDYLFPVRDVKVGVIQGSNW